MKRVALLAFIVFALTLAAPRLALAQQDAQPPQADSQGEQDAHLREQRVERRRRGAVDDDLGTGSDRAIGNLCSDEDALADRCIVVARLPRCPGDPRCPDPTRVRPDADAPQ